jgi:hypothetical protein
MTSNKFRKTKHNGATAQIVVYVSLEETHGVRNGGEGKINCQSM